MMERELATRKLTVFARWETAVLQPFSLQPYPHILLLFGEPLRGIDNNAVNLPVPKLKIHVIIPNKAGGANPV